MGFALRRVQRKDIRMLVRALGGMVIAWMLVCILKYQTDGNPVMGRYLWYAYYVFMMGLPLLMLILSLMTDSSPRMFGSARYLSARALPSMRFAFDGVHKRPPRLGF